LSALHDEKRIVIDGRALVDALLKEVMPSATTASSPAARVGAPPESIGAFGRSLWRARPGHVRGRWVHEARTDTRLVRMEIR
jgi:hypothetical protein